MVTMALYGLLASTPMAFLVFLLCRMSRTAIMSVRRILSETKIERYGIPTLAPNECAKLFACEALQVYAIPIARKITLAEGVTVSS